MSDKNGSSNFLLVIIVLALAIGGIFFFMSNSKDLLPEPDTNQPVMMNSQEDVIDTPPSTEPEEANTDETAADETAVKEPEIVTETKTLALPEADASAPAEQAAVSDDVAAMMEPRTLGSDDAPIKVIEYSSLTCGHCSAFHKDDLPKIQKDYIDTGKVQFIFKEYPLNQPAVIASQVLRCMPKDQYVNFMGLLFDQQEAWAYVPNFQEKLTQYAKLAGMSEDKVKACIGNTELAQKIIENMKVAGEEYKISSTPTFIVNNGEKIIVGHQPYEFFQQSFDALLAGE